MKSQVKFQKRKIDRKVKVWGLVFRKIFRPVIADQESRFLQRLPLLDKPTLKKIMDVDYENKVVALAMRPVYITAATEEAETFLGRIGIFVKSVRPELLLDEKIFKYADKYSFAMAKYVNKTTSRRIKGEILSGLKKKLTWSKIATNIKKNVFKDLSMGYRSRMIARTEAHGIVENGSYEAAKASKIMKEKTWSSGADARPTHTDAHNQTVLLHDHFFVGGYLLDFPGDTSLGASMEEIIHCRCSVMYSSKIHRERLTSSKKLITEVETRRPFTVSKKSAEKLIAEKNRFNKLFDSELILEDAPKTKARIAKELYEKLKANGDYRSLVDFLTQKQKDAGWDFHRRAIKINKSFIQTWAVSSGDNKPLSIAMQLAAHDEFNLKDDLVHFSDKILSTAKEMFYSGSNKEALKAFVRAQYELTQEFFKKNGITSITGYRGMTFGAFGEIPAPPGFVFSPDKITAVKGKLQLQPLSSFASSPGEASNFTGGIGGGMSKMVVQADIPVGRILSTCQTGFGCKEEMEFVVLGGKETFKIATHGYVVAPPGENLAKLFGGMK